MINVGIVGSGRIIPFHIEALRFCGFNVKGISSSLNSKTAKQLASKYSIPQYFSSTEELIESHKQFDAILLAPKSELLFPLLKRIEALEVPTLIEKPVFISSEQIEEFHSLSSDFNWVMVGYNRRYYETIKLLKSEISSRGLMMLRMFVPELSSSRGTSVQDRVTSILNNTVHMLDLFIHLTSAKRSDLQINVRKAKSEFPVIQIDYDSSRCDIVFGVPGNYSIEAVTSDGGVFQLKPLERLLEFEGMSVLEPDFLNPVRRYMPKVKRDLLTSEVMFKPGFIGQANAFKGFIQNLDTSPPYCDLQSAVRVSLLALEIVNLIL